MARALNVVVAVMQGRVRQSLPLESPFVLPLLDRKAPAFGAGDSRESQEFLAMTKALLHDRGAKRKVCLKKLIAAGRAVDDVGGRAVLRHDRVPDSFGGRPFLRSGGLGKVPGMYVESFQPRDELATSARLCMPTI